MRRRIPPLNQLRAFEAAARHSSFTKAAEEMCITQGAISRQVKALEDYLGFELFERTGAGVELTAAASAFGNGLSAALDKIARVTDELVASRTRRVLTVRGYTCFLMRWLAPMLPDFQREASHIDVRLMSSTENTNFDTDQVDIAIMYGEGVWPGVKADLLFGDEIVPVCSAELLRSGNVVRGARDLRHFMLLHHYRRPRDWSDWLAAAGCPDLRANGDRMFEDLSVAYECMLAGMGFLITQRAYVQRDLEAGRVIAPFDTVLHRRRGYYLAYRKEHAEWDKVAAFRNWLLSRCAGSSLPRLDGSALTLMDKTDISAPLF